MTASPSQHQEQGDRIARRRPDIELGSSAGKTAIPRSTSRIVPAAPVTRSPPRSAPGTALRQGWHANDCGRGTREPRTRSRSRQHLRPRLGRRQVRRASASAKVSAKAWRRLLLLSCLGRTTGLALHASCCYLALRGERGAASTTFARTGRPRHPAAHCPHGPSNSSHSLTLGAQALAPGQARGRPRRYSMPRSRAASRGVKFPVDSIMTTPPWTPASIAAAVRVGIEVAA